MQPCRYAPRKTVIFRVDAHIHVGRSKDSDSKRPTMPARSEHVSLARRINGAFGQGFSSHVERTCAVSHISLCALTKTLPALSRVGVLIVTKSLFIFLYSSRVLMPIVTCNAAAGHVGLSFPASNWYARHSSWYSMRLRMTTFMEAGRGRRR